MFAKHVTIVHDSSRLTCLLNMIVHDSSKAYMFVKHLTIVHDSSRLTCLLNM